MGGGNWQFLDPERQGICLQQPLGSCPDFDKQPPHCSRSCKQPYLNTAGDRKKQQHRRWTCWEEEEVQGDWE